MSNLGKFKKLDNNQLDKIKGGDVAQNGSDIIIVEMGKKTSLPKLKK